MGAQLNAFAEARDEINLASGEALLLEAIF
jgi:hypothetical protein